MEFNKLEQQQEEKLFKLKFGSLSVMSYCSSSATSGIIDNYFSQNLLL